MKHLFLIFVLISINTSASEITSDWDSGNLINTATHIEVAKTHTLLPSFIKSGESIFSTKFNIHDGAGRPAATGDSKPTSRNSQHNIHLSRIAGPDAMSCAGCHNQPKIGGSGDFVANAFVGAHFTDPPTDSIKSEITNERNTTTIFGTGLIEIVAREITNDLHLARHQALETAKNSNDVVKVALESKGISFGSITVHPNGYIDFTQLEGIDYDLSIRPFGVKGIAASLREFTIAALNQHHGMQAVERFGWERTGRKDFDLDGIENEISVDQLSALVLFQASLEAPQQQYSDDKTLAAREKSGERHFERIGCVDCHIPSVTLTNNFFIEPNPYNRPGAIKPNDIGFSIKLPLARTETVVNAYTDFKRHKICDEDVSHFCNEKLKQDNVALNEFLTSKLWDLNTSAPYGHGGDLSTISGAIVAHGGEARESRDKFMGLSDKEKESVVLFLKTLGAKSYD